MSTKGTRTAGASGSRRAGFALVAVMVATGLACLVAGTVVTVALASSKISRADARLEAATAAVESGLEAALDTLAWGGGRDLVLGASRTLVRGQEDCQYSAEITRLPSVAGDASWLRRFHVDAEGRSGSGRAVGSRDVVTQPQALPCGVTVADSLTCSAELAVEGCGIQCGGDVRGRQLISLGSSDDLEALAPDYAHGDLWPVAGVHAGGRIYAEGVEIHAVAAGRWPSDGDVCTAATPPARLVRLPDARAVAALSARAVLAETAAGDSLNLEALPSGGACGLIVVLEAAAEPLRICGWRAPPPADELLTLLIDGDAVLDREVGAQEDAGVALSGQLIVTGTLTVRTPALVEGSLSAGALDVLAPLVVHLHEGWREAPAPGPLAVLEEERP